MKKKWPSMGNNGKGANWVKQGDRFGNWVVVQEDSERRNKNGRYWFCRCKCGKIKSVAQHSLRGWLNSGRGSASCGGPGCRLWRTHGQSKTALYKIWSGIKARCMNTENPAYSFYGGRGIRLCKKWMKFEHFAEDMGPRPSTEHSVERVNTNGNYSPSNCVWATRAEQQRNMRSNVFLTHKGERLHLSGWARKLGMRVDLVCQRYSRGMTTKDVLHVGELRQDRKRKRRAAFGKN